MAVKFRNQYTSELEYLYDVAKSSDTFREEDYNLFANKKEGENYIYAVAGTEDMTSDSFNMDDYNLLGSEDRFGYLYTHYYMDKNDKDYQNNINYYNEQVNAALDKKTFDSLNGFQKVVRTIGGYIGDFLNTAILGTAENLIDSVLTGASWFAELGDPNVVDWKGLIAKDVTGYYSNAEKLQRFKRANTYIDKNKILSVVNDVTNAIGQQMVSFIPSVGPGLFITSLLGSSGSEATMNNADIETWKLFLYTAGNTAMEYITEGLSAKLGSKIGMSSVIDRQLFGKTPIARNSWIKELGFDFLSEGLEESVSEFTNSLMYKWLVDKDADISSFEDVLYAGLIGGLTGGVMKGADIAITPNYFKTKDGKLITRKDAKDLGINLKDTTKLSIGDKYFVKNAMRVFKENPTAIYNSINNLSEGMSLNSNVVNLQSKYSDLTLDEIQTQHKKEYDDAVKKDAEFQENSVESVFLLSKVLELAGEDGFRRAVDLANKTIDEQIRLIKNYTDYQTSKTQFNTALERSAEIRFAKENEGYTFRTRQELTELQRKLKLAMKNDYGIDIYFGDFGSEDGSFAKNGYTLDDSTILLDADKTQNMSLDTLLDSVVKERLAETLQFNSGLLNKNNVKALLELIGEDVSKIADDTRLNKDQIKILANMILFDKKFIKTMVMTNKNLFSDVYNWCNKRADVIDKKKGRKSMLDKKTYSSLVNIMADYRDSMASFIGNEQDIDTATQELPMNEEQARLFKANVNPDYMNAHYILLKSDYSMNTKMRDDASKDLSQGRNLMDKIMPFDYNRAFDLNYYTQEFKDKVWTDKSKDFKYNLQKYLLNNYNFVINPREGCLSESIPIQSLTNKNFKEDLVNFNKDNNSLVKYTTLDTIFEKDFVDKFNTEDGNLLKDVDLKFVYRPEKSSVVAEYTYQNKDTLRPSITVYVDDSMTSGNNINQLEYKLYHEINHALGDIQGFSNGTSSSYVKSCLLNASNQTVDYLAKKMLTNKFYEENKNNREALLDAISYRVYSITDGEYAAEASAMSVTRKGDTQLNLRAGTGLNASGFVVNYKEVKGVDLRKVLTGYGTFKGIELYADSITTKTGAVDSKSLKKAAKIVGVDENLDFKDFLKNNMGISDYKTVGFPQEVIDYLDSGKTSRKALLRFINKGGFKNNSENLIIAYAKPNNENMKTIQDVDRASTYNIAIAKAFYDKNPKATTITESQIESFLRSNENYNSFEKYRREYAALLDKEENSSIKSYLVDNDFDYSKDAIRKLDVNLKNGLNNKLKTTSTEVKSSDSSEDLSILNTEEYATESPEEVFLKTLEDSKDMSLDEFVNKIEDYVNNSSAEDIFRLVKILTNSEKSIAIQNEIKKLFGEEAWDKVKSILPPKKDIYVQKIKRRLKKLDNMYLNETDSKLLTEDYSNYKPAKFEAYIAKLDAVIEKNTVKTKEKAKEIIDNKKKILSQNAVEAVKTETTREKTKVEVKSTKNALSKLNKKQVEKVKTNLVKEANLTDKQIEKAVETVNKATEPITPEKNKQSIVDILNDDSYRTDPNSEYYEKRVSQGQGYDTNYEYYKASQADFNEVKGVILHDLTDAEISSLLDDIQAGKVNSLDATFTLTYLQFEMKRKIKDEAIRKRIDDMVQEDSTRTAQKEAARNEYFTEKHPVEAFAKEISEKTESTFTVSDDLVVKFIPEYKNKQTWLDELNADIELLEASIKEEKDLFNKYKLKQLKRDKIKLANILMDGDKVALLDYYINELKDSETNSLENQDKVAEITTNIVNEIIHHVDVHNDKMSYSTKRRILSPERQRWLYDRLQFIQSFSYISMLASPGAMGRNALSNTGVYLKDIIDMRLAGTFEKTKFLQNVNQLNYNGDYDIDFSNAVENLYKNRIKEDTSGTKYSNESPSETNELKKQYAREKDPIKKNKILSKIQEYENKFLNDQPWTMRKSLKYLKATLAGSIQKIQSDIYTHLATIYKIKDSTYDANKLYNEIKKTNVELANKFKEAVIDGDMSKTLNLANELELELLENIYNKSLYRANKLFFKTDNAISTFIKNAPAPVKAIVNVLNPFIKVAVNTTIYTIDHSPIGIAKGLIKSLQTRQMYLNDMRIEIDNHFRSEYKQILDETNKQYKKDNIDKRVTFKPSEYKAWLEKTKSKEVVDILNGSNKGLSQLHAKMVSDGIISGSSIGAADVFARADALEYLAKGTTGTVLLALGIGLSLLLDIFEYDEEDYLGPVIRVGNLKIKMTDLAPFTTLFVVGAMMKAETGNKSKFEALAQILIEQSFLGVIDSSMQYNSSLTDFVPSQLINYVQRYIPTIVKSVTKIIDGGKKDKSGNFFEKLYKTTVANLPFLSLLIPNKINPYTGEVERYYEKGWFEGLINALSTIQFRIESMSDLEKEAMRLGTETTFFTGDFDYNGQSVKLSNKEKEQAARFKGSYLEDYYKKMVNGDVLITVEDSNGKRVTKRYSQLTDDEKSRALKQLYTSATELTKINYWLSKGNKYYETSSQKYYKYYDYLDSSNYIYKKSWDKSKFIQ